MPALAFGAVPRPFPFTTISESDPAASTADGYQPTGMRPTGWSPFGDETAASRNTATALLSASATYSRLPSSESAIASGVLPSVVGEPGGSDSVDTTVAVRVLMM